MFCFPNIFPIPVYGPVCKIRVHKIYGPSKQTSLLIIHFLYLGREVAGVLFVGCSISLRALLLLNCAWPNGESLIKKI